MRIYTRRGDGGTTDLRVGGRVPKDSRVIELVGTVDEAQAALGMARAETTPGSELDAVLAGLERDLWIVMAEVATGTDRRDGLEPGVTAVTSTMVRQLESRIDVVMATLDLERGFAVPGGTRCSAALDLARTVVRRAERVAAGHGADTSLVGAFLNRLSDLCWALARSTEGEHLRVRDVSPGERARGDAAGTGRGASGSGDAGGSGAGRDGSGAGMDGTDGEDGGDR